LVLLAKLGYFYRDVYGHEIDFIFVDEQRKLFPIEVKFKKKIDREDVKNLLLFLRKLALTSGFLIAQIPVRERMKLERKVINIVPYYEFKQASLITPKQR
jgi:predicted AAA+ superfamily ATPase